MNSLLNTDALAPMPMAAENTAIEALDRKTFARRTGIRPSDYKQLQRTPLFTDMGDDALMALLRDARLRRFRRGAAVFEQSARADRFYIVTAGWIKAYCQDPDGQENVIAVFGPGESLAEADMFMSGDFPFSARAAANARLVMVPRTGILNQLRNDPDVALGMLASMSRPLCGFAKQLEQFTVKPAVQRLALFLKELVGMEEGSGEIELPLDKVLIARRLGMQPETLSRALSKLRSIGVVSNGNRVIVGDIAALQSMTAAGA